MGVGATKPSKASPVRRRLWDQSSDGDERDQPHPTGEESTTTAKMTTMYAFA